MIGPFNGPAGHPTSETTFEWDCGCIAHSFEGEMNVRACCQEHDDPLDDFVTASVLAVNPDAEIERIYTQPVGGDPS